MSSPDKRKTTDSEDQNTEVDQEIGPEPKKIKTDSPDQIFQDFVLDEVLSQNAQNKVAFVRGHYDGITKEPAVVTVEKTPFTQESLSKILSAESQTNLTLKNDIYSTYELIPTKELSAIKTSLIFPATEKHIAKYRAQNIFLIEESGDDYKNITLPYLESETFSIQWVYNILEKKQEADRIVFEDPDPDTGFILLPDMKWDRKQVEDLYLVAIIQKHGIWSIRDLTGEHLPLLKNILAAGTAAVTEKFGVPSSQLRIFFHYQPSYYHLHIHFTHLKFNAPGSGVERAHLLSDVIENLQFDEKFYQKKTLAFTLRDGDKLFKKFEAAGRV